MILSVQGLWRQVGGRQLLQDANMQIQPGEKAFLVGINGSGKSTLLRMIAGDSLPDDGRIQCRGSLGTLDQRLDNFADTLFNSVHRAFDWLLDIESELGRLHTRMAEPEVYANPAELQRIMERAAACEEQFRIYGGDRIESVTRSVLAGMGFGPDDYDRDPSELSGGQKSRLALAQLIAASPDLLLLDEPTNHLDIENIQWLEQFLRRTRSATLIVTHDRRLIDQLAERIFEIDAGRIESYKGNYRQYLQERQQRYLHLQRQNERIERTIEREEAFIDRYRAGVKSSQASGRQKRLERYRAENQIREIDEHRQFHPRFEPRMQPGPGTMLQVRNLSKAFGDTRVLCNLNFDVQAGERIGIIGRNGSGKSTLLRILGNLVPADSGRWELGNLVEMSVFTQDHSEMDPERSLIEQLRETAPRATTQELRGLLARYQFRTDEQDKLVGHLSGGELSRLAFASLELSCGNLLLLDEPSNHLDIDGVDAIIEGLQEFSGALLIVSHDRHLLEQTCNRLLLMQDGNLEVYEGDYSSYTQTRPPSSEQESAPGPQTGEPRQPQAPARQPGVNKWKLAELEDRIEELEQRQAALAQELDCAGEDYELVRRLGEEHSRLETQISEALERWEAMQS